MSENSVLLLAGTNEQLAIYDDVFADESEPESLVLVLGGGRVGRLTARALEQRGIAYRVVERDATRPGQNEHWLIGNAAELSVLKEAGIDEATTVVITTHDDDTNVYLALYSRKLRPSAKILSRATDHRHVASIHRAGADFVLSFASIGASVLFNLLDVGRVMIVADGLNLFRVETPRTLDGKTLADSSIRALTGATLVAVEDGQGKQTINPPADFRLLAGTRLILVGSVEAEQHFIKSFGR
jgi:Trk K+ transport system NAD-binding subunit